MPKTLSLILILILIIGTLFACKRKYINIDEPSTKPVQTSEESSSDTTQPETTGDLSSTEETTSEETSAESTTDIITADTIEGIYIIESNSARDTYPIEMFYPENFLW